MNTLIVLMLFGCQGAPPVAPPSVEPTAHPVAITTPAIVTDIDVEKVLDQLEEQGRTLKDFTASATMEKFEALTDDREIRRGRVVVVGPSGGQREIAIIFDETIDSTGRGSTDSRRFIFAKGWLSEFDVERKQLIRRQLAREGETFDPLRVGEGAFPVPLGQPKADVLREFTVTIGEIPTAPFFKSLQSSDLIALRLVPRAGTEMARDTAAIVMVFEKTTVAPKAVEVQAVNGDRTRVLLREGKLNAGLEAESRALLVAPSTDGWKIDVRPMQ